jgi:Zn-dependent protease with chaperone function
MAKTTSLAPVLGIPVVHVPGLPVTAETSGIGPWAKILVGEGIFRLEPRVAGAVLLHEAGHIKLGHLRKRVVFALLNFWRPMAIGHYCREQEFEADRFAAGCGYARELALYFMIVNAVSGPYHPPRSERVLRLAAHPQQAGI